MCIKCKACGNDMDMVEAAPGVLDILCDTCIAAGADAITHDQYYYEGLWWDKHWSATQGDGKARYEALNERLKA